MEIGDQQATILTFGKDVGVGC